MAGDEGGRGVNCRADPLGAETPRFFLGKSGRIRAGCGFGFLGEGDEYRECRVNDCENSCVGCEGCGGDGGVFAVFRGVGACAGDFFSHFLGGKLDFGKFRISWR